MTLQHRLLMLRLTCLFVLSTCFMLANAAKIDDVFLVHYQDGVNNVDTVEGDCGRTIEGSDKKYGDVLNSWWDDVTKLVKRVNEDWDKFNTKSVEGHLIRENLRTLFGIQWDKDKLEPLDESQDQQFKGVKETFGILEKLVDGEFDWDMGWKDQDKRQLYCDSDWLPETDLVYNKDGIVLKKEDEEGKEVELNIHDDKDDIDRLFPDHGFPDEIFGGSDDDRGARAYWSKYNNRYSFEKKADGKLDRYKQDGSGARHYCNGLVRKNDPGIANTDSQSLGENIGGDGGEKYSDESILALNFCPESFKRFDFETATGLAADQRKEDTKIKAIQPRSLTLLHELIHVINGPISTPDDLPGNNQNWKNMYGIDKVLGAAKSGSKNTADMTNLPEPYAFYALSYWLGTGADEDKYDWSSGRARALPTFESDDS